VVECKPRKGKEKENGKGSANVLFTTEYNFGRIKVKDGVRFGDLPLQREIQRLLGQGKEFKSVRSFSPFPS